MPEQDNGGVSKMAPLAATPPSGRLPDGGASAVRRVASVVLRAPLDRRAWMELLACLIGLPLGLAGFIAVVVPLALGAGLSVTLIGTIPGLLLLVGSLALARALGWTYRRLAARLLGERVAAPPPARTGSGALGRLGARLRDGAAWRSLAYLAAKLPLSVLGGYAAGLWVLGVVNISYPFWWAGFRNHPPGTTLRPVPVITLLPMGRFEINSYAGTFAALAVGLATVLLAPWATRVVAGADRWLVRALLGPGAMEARVRDLEETRALAVDDSAATLRRLERDLHDGTQARLVALAMNLGMAREKLGESGGAPDADRARELVASAHQTATEAIAELRDLARGIHPPVLDGGLEDALRTLAARSSVSVDLRVNVPHRPTAAIETIAYFCAAELLANVLRHSRARNATVEAAERDGRLCLLVRDDGVGGARLGAGSGLGGLAQRVRTVDGRLAIDSPEGGPTEVVVELPLHA
jgi:signal transduction histidine kinase